MMHGPEYYTPQMNQLCKVCGEPAAGFHFGAFTCEGCKSFFGRSYNNLAVINECKNNGNCIINKKNRTSCKACRLKKCLMVGMSKSGSRYGRRSNWFKIHCLLQEQSNKMPGLPGNEITGDISVATEQAVKELNDYKDELNFPSRTSSAESLPPRGSPPDKLDGLCSGFKGPIPPSVLFPYAYNHLPSLQPMRTVMPWPLFPMFPSNFPNFPMLPSLSNNHPFSGNNNNNLALRRFPPYCWTPPKHPEREPSPRDFEVKSNDSGSVQDEPIDLSVKREIDSISEEAILIKREEGEPEEKKIKREDEEEDVSRRNRASSPLDLTKTRT